MSLVELNLADNLISKVENISRLINLNILDLSANPFENFKDIEEINTLPVLKNLSFASIYFDSSPIVDIHNYRNYVLCTVTSPYFEV